MQLSVLIPARNEEFLKRTVEDILSHIEGETEVIVVLDGYTTELPNDPRVKVIHNEVAKGQRAATNQACRLSEAKYVMKTDAHVSFDQGFDVKMLEAFKETGDNVTMVPVMKNLHAFDWVCEDGHRRYQSPSGPCKECNKPTIKDVVWIAKKSPNSTSFRFDQDLHFQYFGEYKSKQVGDLVETMSLQGSCFMLTREKYWELDICEEAFGSWGQQGVEVACKTWLSGGRVICNKRTYYAHMFRTQGGDFGFPYELKQSDVQKARDYSKDLFLKDTWPKAIHPLSWLLDKFAPVPDWHDKKKTAGIVYFSDVRIYPRILKECQDQIIRSFTGPIVSATLKPIDFGKNIHLDLERGQLTMFKQILAGLEALDTDYVFLCDDDVLYHPSHFEFVPPRDDVFYYNLNWWRLRTSDGFAVNYEAKQSNFLCANRQLMIREYKERVRRVELEGWQNGGYEPGTKSIRRGGFGDSPSATYTSKYPSIDIRHGMNLTHSKWKPEDFRQSRSCRNWKETTVDNIDGWDNLRGILDSSDRSTADLTQSA